MSAGGMLRVITLICACNVFFFLSHLVVFVGAQNNPRVQRHPGVPDCGRGGGVHGGLDHVHQEPGTRSVPTSEISLTDSERVFAGGNISVFALLAVFCVPVLEVELFQQVTPTGRCFIRIPQ